MILQAPCQHNFCLKCFKDLVAKAKNKACPSCRHSLSAKFCENPRINTALASAIRAFKAGYDAKTAKKTFVRIGNDERPDEAFTTERAQRSGRANAASGRIMVSVPNDHFGPIPPEADPRGTGVQVGEWWKDRLDCRQWGAHFPHVAGIAGQSNVGAQSVVLSGGYEDDRDEGEWFLYTGSGGRDLSGNKRTNKIQSFDQTFENMNKALKLSCEKGLPVRVVRSFKEKRSSYAPSGDTPVRYDGIYRIVKCWRIKGRQGLLICRYLFIRADNDPAPWSSEETGDRPGLESKLPAPALAEIKKANKKVVYSMSEKPYWGWNEEAKTWGWTRDPPVSQKCGTGKGGRRKLSEHEKALREMTCGICKDILKDPVSAPCGHNMCKNCLDKKFGGQEFEIDAGALSGRSLRIRKVAMRCPCYGCNFDLCDFLKTAQINRDMASMISRLQKEVASIKAAQKGEENESETDMVIDEISQAHEKVSAVASDEFSNQAENGALGDGSQETQSSVFMANSRARRASLSTRSAASDLKDTQINTAMSSNLTAPNASGQHCRENKIYSRIVEDLCTEFPEFDTLLVQSLVEQEEGDARDVRVALSRMRNDMLLDERKKAKQRKSSNESALNKTSSEPKKSSAKKRKLDDSASQTSAVSSTRGKVPGKRGRR